MAPLPLKDLEATSRAHMSLAAKQTQFLTARKPPFRAKIFDERQTQTQADTASSSATGSKRKRTETAGAPYEERRRAIEDSINGSHDENSDREHVPGAEYKAAEAPTSEQIKLGVHEEQEPGSDESSEAGTNSPRYRVRSPKLSRYQPSYSKDAEINEEAEDGGNGPGSTGREAECEAGSDENMESPSTGPSNGQKLVEALFNIIQTDRLSQHRLKLLAESRRECGEALLEFQQAQLAEKRVLREYGPGSKPSS